jgi:Uma2 family endonuclease
MSASPLKHEVFYPESDGRPMAETDLHRREMMDLIEALDDYFAGSPDVYVSGNLLLYYVQGDATKSVAPDVFVVRGVPKGNRRVYKLWEEGRVPILVVEVTSESSRREDQGKKRDLYERLGVEEYFLHDPLEEYLDPPLRGFRLEGGLYRPIEPEPDGSLRSLTTGLTLRPGDGEVRLVETATDRVLPWPAERAEALRRAEEEIARLREELSRRRASEP